jgi:hypothetical protein
MLLTPFSGAVLPTFSKMVYRYRITSPALPVPDLAVLKGLPPNNLTSGGRH